MEKKKIQGRVRDRIIVWKKKKKNTKIERKMHILLFNYLMGAYVGTRAFTLSQKDGELLFSFPLFSPIFLKVSSVPVERTSLLHWHQCSAVLGTLRATAGTCGHCTPTER